MRHVDQLFLAKTAGFRRLFAALTALAVAVFRASTLEAFGAASASVDAEVTPARAMR